jgi:hypothetical protein
MSKKLDKLAAETKRLTLLRQVQDGAITLPEAARRVSLADNIERFPKGERERVGAFLHALIKDGTHTQIVVEIADNLLEMQRDGRLRIYALNESGNDRDRDLARTEAAKLPPMPHPALMHLRNAGREIARAARHMNGDGWCDDIRQDINSKITSLKDNAA